jgi:hypothetical protein
MERRKLEQRVTEFEESGDKHCSEKDPSKYLNGEALGKPHRTITRSVTYYQKEAGDPRWRWRPSASELGRLVHGNALLPAKVTRSYECEEACVNDHRNYGGNRRSGIEDRIE